MKHTFRPKIDGSHTRVIDGVRGDLKSYAPTVNTWASVLVDPDDFELFEAPPEVIPVIVPFEVANWRARAVLELAGLLPATQAAITAMTGDAGIVARAAWNSGAPFVRNGPTVRALSTILELTDAQVDGMFIQAESLTV